MPLTMQDKFKVIKPSRISYKVADQIKKLVFTGTLKSGDKLPSERELSKMIGVGRFSLREGLRILESMGILETKYGPYAGTYVSEMAIENLSEKISDILRLGSITLDQLFEVRMELGLIILKYFYRRANTTDIKTLEKCIDEAENLFKRGDQPREKFIEFHRLIARGSKNPVFLLLYNSLLDILLKKFLSKFTSYPEHSKKFLAYNKKILDSLKERDMDKASVTLKKYLAYLKKITEARAGLLGQGSDQFGPMDSLES